MRDLFLLAMILVMTLLSGCSLYRQGESRSNSSLVEYLYPNNKQGVLIEPTVPVLSLPLKVGIAFVPEGCSSYNRFGLSENQKNRLLKEISDSFLSNHRFFEKMDVIPSQYLLRKGGFENLDDIKKNFDIDVIVLLSYDQVQYTNENFVSLVYYYTLVGEYIFEGDKNDTNTLIDAAVYDIASRKMLFRATGTSLVKGESTRARLTEQLRQDSYQGFESAISKLNVQLAYEMYSFRQKLKKKETDVTIAYRSGSRGGGSFDMFGGVLIILFGAVRYFRKQKN